MPPPPVITTAAHPPQTISGNPNYTPQQQLYIQQQQQLYAQQQQQYQTLRRKQQAQAVAQAQAQAQAQGQMNQIPPQQIYQPNPNQQDKNQLPPPPQVTQQLAMTQPQQNPPVQHQQYVTSSGMIYTPASMAVVTANNAIYVQSSQAPPTQQHASIDNNMMFDRDKQIYKCSTLGRYGAKFNAQHQQNLVPAVIPTVPQLPKYNNQAQVTTGAVTVPTQMTTNTQVMNNANLRPSIQNCPLPDIPSVGTFKGNNDDIGIGTNNENMPHNRCVLTDYR